MAAVTAVLFDVAGTLLVKSGVPATICSVLRSRHIAVGEDEVAFRHKLLSEALPFPDRTSASFYREFNAALLRSLGVVPDGPTLDAIYKQCRRVPWEAAPGAHELRRIDVRCGVVSNFSTDLPRLLEQVPRRFDPVVVSEAVGLRKPDLRIFEVALSALGGDPSKVVYVGDSIELDMEPSAALGMVPVLIDRLGVYPAYEGLAVADLSELPDLLDSLG